ncbi:MAG TPA: FAD-dependent oxidoreductase [Acidimicrobiia bacterium]|nr:FAD-dependent oxidoreductase [Acidimicrobiia bacterium]
MTLIPADAAADDPSAPILDAAQLAVLAGFGQRRPVAVGDVLYAEGDPAYDFYVLLSGVVEITGRFDGEDVVVATHGSGRFLGELNLLTGQRVYLTARVVEAGEVIAIGVPDLRRLIATVPGVADTILGAFVARRSRLLEGAARSLRVIGSRHLPEALAMVEFLSRNRVPHQWLDAETDPDICRLVEEFNVTCGDLPVVLVGSTVLRQATPGLVAQYLGLTIESIPERCFDLIVVGAGPAGLAASVYGASEGLATLTVESQLPGGQAGTSSRIENYLGFPAGISGSDLTALAMTQALKFGATLTTPCEVLGLLEKGGHVIVRLSDGTEIAGRAVVAASGAHYRRLGVPDLARFEGAGVFYAATEIEARMVAGEPVVVVGGGNSAGQAALFLAKNNCSVTLLIRGTDLGRSMSRYLADRIESHPGITVRTGTQVAALHGNGSLEAITVDGPEKEEELGVTGVFSFIGAEPNSGWLAGCAALDAKGFVLTDRALGPDALGPAWDALARDPLPFETSLPGLFAVGDVRAGSMKRVASAVGEGSAAVRSVHEHLAAVPTA